MNSNIIDIIPVTRARRRLGSLAEKVLGENYVILTKGGAPKAAIVDIDYLVKLQNEVRKLYQKTFITPRLLPYTRKFKDKEIREWQKEDAL